MRRIIFLLWLLLLLAGCGEVDYFADYREVNLLESYPLNHTGWQSNTTATYLNYEAITLAEAGDSASLPADTDIHRLEIPNLFENGDFLNNAAGWGGGGTYNWIDGSDPKAISGGTLSYSISASLDRIEFNLSALEKGHYRLAFDLTKEPADVIAYAIFEGGEETRTWVSGYSPATDNTLIHFQDIVADPTFSLVNDTLVAAFSLNSIDKANVHNDSCIDNIRLVRTDVSAAVSIDLPLLEGDRLPFVPGTYRFSLYVKQEEDSQVTPAVGNRFRGSGLGITLSGIEETGDQTFTVRSSSRATFRDTDEGADWSSWSQVYVDDIVQVDESGADDSTVIRLTVEPLDDNCGSLLIACPELELLP